MDTLKLKALLAIDKYGSFTKAAEEFSYTPSAFSHMADSLENEFGVKLFTRTHQGVSLTPQAKELKEKIERLICAEEELSACLGKIRQGDGITIVTYASIAKYILPEAIKEFKLHNKYVKFSIEVTDCMKEAIKRTAGDVYIGDCSAFPNSMHHFPLVRDRYVAVVPKNQFSNRKSVDKNELYQYPYIKTNETILERELDDGKFKEIIHFNSAEDFSLLNLVAQNIGITITNELVTKDKIKGIKAIPLHPPIFRMLGVAFDEKVCNQVIKDFILFLKSKYECPNGKEGT